MATTSVASEAWATRQRQLYNWVGRNWPAIKVKFDQYAETRPGGLLATDKIIGMIDVRLPSGKSIDDVVYEDLTTEVHFITVDNVCNELMDTIYHLLHDHWKFPKQYAKERTLETVILVGEVGVVVFAFGDQPGDNFQVHSLCTLRNDFIRLLAERGTPLDAPVASTSAAAE